MNSINISPEDLRLMQLNELELLAEVDRICRKNNIIYSLDGGSLLGAVRHKGFIPWDDDADVIFTRSEYDKFFEACKKDLNTEKFFLQEHRTDPFYRWGYSKLRLLGTEFVRSGQEHMKYKTGICIDVFVNDNVPDGCLSRRLHHAIHFCIRKILYSELGMVEAPRAFQRGVYKLLNKISVDRVFNIIRKIYTHYNAHPTKLICHTLFPTPGVGNKYGIDASFLAESEDVEFEGMLFMASTKRHEYLTSLYGDYMTPPPAEKRHGPSYPSKLALLPVTLDEIHAEYDQNN
ncbi:MAG: LicD family protein [Lachnospiraceae bacterium]|nr:LicD family protein [Lachnospiraceae bacterium]